jgi:hypothetical protein
MLSIEVGRTARRLPPVILVGVVLMVAGALLDVIVLASAGHHGHEELAGQHLAHMAAVAGMVLVLVGVVTRGVRSHRRAKAATHGGLDHDAHR